MDRSRRLSTGVAWRYLREVGDALHHAHEAGFVHRDLKPGNVLIHSDGRALLCDFGLARAATQEVRLTSVGFAVGTPGYMAPEQVMGRQVDRRADVYAMGVMVFEMLTGRLPYLGATPMEVQYATVGAPIPSACEINPELPDDLDALLQRVLAKDPAARPTSAASLVLELGRLPQYRSSGQVRVMAAQTLPPPPARPPATPPPSVQLRPPTSNSPLPGSAVHLLEQQGVGRLRGVQQFSLNSHWHNTVKVAREVAGDQWRAIAEIAGLEQFLTQDPVLNEEYTNPIETLSRLNEAFELVYGKEATDRIRKWGRVATDRSLTTRSSAVMQRAFRMVPGQQRKLTMLLNAFTTAMDRVRGEHTHTFRRVDDRQFWLVHYSNLYALGRIKSEKSCWVWTSSFESMLRWSGLANEWFVEELECGTVTGTFDCVFVIRRSRG